MLSNFEKRQIRRLVEKEWTKYLNTKRINEEIKQEVEHYTAIKQMQLELAGEKEIAIANKKYAKLKER